MVTMLKALPLVHFSNALLLRERIKIYNIFFLSQSKQVVQLSIISKKNEKQMYHISFLWKVFGVSLLIAAYCGLQTLQIIEKFFKNANTSVKTTTGDFCRVIQEDDSRLFCSCNIVLNHTRSCQLTNISNEQRISIISPQKLVKLRSLFIEMFVKQRQN